MEEIKKTKSNINIKLPSPNNIQHTEQYSKNKAKYIQIKNRTLK